MQLEVGINRWDVYTKGCNLEIKRRLLSKSLRDTYGINIPREESRKIAVMTKEINQINKFLGLKSN